MTIDRIYFLSKKAVTPITIMMIPHENVKSLNLKIPLFGILLALLLFAVGAIQTCGLVVNGLRYPSLMEQVDFYTQKFSEWNSTMSALTQTEKDFRRIFSLTSKDNVIDAIDTSYSGDIDIENLMGELQKNIERIDEIKDYLRIQKDLYLATPKGYPVGGKISSPYGKRASPFGGGRAVHSGIDISATSGTPVQATADGVVCYSGWNPHSGYLVVIEHGCGFSTAYAHNKRNLVKMGQQVKRGDIVGHVGSSGRSTGPHVHYEVWDKGKRVNPSQFFEGRS